MNYAVYTQQGEILRIISCPPKNAESQPNDGQLLAEVAYDVMDDTHYISDGVALSKQEIQLVHTLSELSCEVSGVPAGCLVTIAGEEGEMVADGDPINFTFDEPDTYTIKVAGGVEYLDTELEVTIGHV